jgi:hypothetical protein
MASDKPASNISTKIVDGIFTDLGDRRWLKWIFDESVEEPGQYALGQKVLGDIRETWIKIVDLHLESSSEVSTASEKEEQANALALAMYNDRYGEPTSETLEVQRSNWLRGFRACWLAKRESRIEISRLVMDNLEETIRNLKRAHRSLYNERHDTGHTVEGCDECRVRMAVEALKDLRSYLTINSDR